MVAEAQIYAIGTCAIGIITILNILVALYLSGVLYKSTLFMQNKPNLLNAQMDVNTIITMDYENISDWTLGENKPNSNPIKPNSNPKQTQSNPIKPNFKPNSQRSADPRMPAPACLRQGSLSGTPITTHQFCKHPASLLCLVHLQLTLFILSSDFCLLTSVLYPLFHVKHLSLPPHILLNIPTTPPSLQADTSRPFQAQPCTATGAGRNLHSMPHARGICFNSPFRLSQGNSPAGR